jgi:hypothetical protein
LPEQLQNMLAAYERYVVDNHVLPMPVGYDHIKQLAINTMRKQLTEPLLIAILTLLILLPFYVAYRMRLRQ